MLGVGPVFLGAGLGALVVFWLLSAWMGPFTAKKGLGPSMKRLGAEKGSCDDRPDF